MGLLDTISEGIIRVVLLFVGLFLLFLGAVVGVTGGSMITMIIAVIILLVGFGILYASSKYKRQ